MRKAMVVGWNGPGPDQLRFAESDALKIAACLMGPTLGYETVLLSPETTAQAFREQLLKFLESATRRDIVIVHLACHGVLDAGELILLPNSFSSASILSTGVAAVDILRAFRRCLARNKLLLLDCCHAAGAAAQLDLRGNQEVQLREITGVPENFLILAASGRLERAREMSILEAGFFSHHLEHALISAQLLYASDPLHFVVDYLQERANDHNAAAPMQAVPVPILLGSQRKPFPLVADGPLAFPSIKLSDGTDIIILPLRDTDFVGEMRDPRWGIGASPITNRQYRRFVEATGYPEPLGEHWTGTRWSPGFYPWRHEGFCDDSSPVVCVSAHDALAYVDWVNQLALPNSRATIQLAPPRVWEFAAFGPPPYDFRNPQTWLRAQAEIHHRATGPVPCGAQPTRSVRCGPVDMIGNVWEWCHREYEHPHETLFIGAPEFQMQYEIRGGGWLDDLTNKRPFLSARALREGEYTKHSDLGFRLAAQLHPS